MAKKAEQLEVFEDDADPALQRAARDYERIRDERMELTRKEVQANSRLVELMKDRQKTRYHRGDLDIEIKAGKYKATVRRGAEDGEDAEAAE